MSFCYAYIYYLLLAMTYQRVFPTKRAMFIFSEEWIIFITSDRQSLKTFVTYFVVTVFVAAALGGFKKVFVVGFCFKADRTFLTATKGWLCFPAAKKCHW